MKIILATENKVKVTQLKDILKEFPLEVVSLTELCEIIGEEFNLPPENGTTYAENSKIKCTAVIKFLDKINFDKKDVFVIGDDSGFEISALNGFPGLISARWAKKQGEAGKKELISQVNNAIRLNPKLDYKSKFVCVVTLINLNNNSIYSVYGEVKGRLIYPPRGNKHFYYDSMMVPDNQIGVELTAGEMDLATKQKYSSRIIAFQKLKSIFSEIFSEKDTKDI